MACSCGNGFNFFQRVLSNPITSLDKLEYELVSGNPYQFSPVREFERFSFLSNYSGFSGASQSVLMGKALSNKSLGKEIDLTTVAFLSGAKYPLITTVLAHATIPEELFMAAMINNLSEDKVVKLVRGVLSNVELG